MECRKSPHDSYLTTMFEQSELRTGQLNQKAAEENYGAPNTTVHKHNTVYIFIACYSMFNPVFQFVYNSIKCDMTP